MFIGTDRGLENDLVPRSGYELKTIDAYGFSKSISITNIKHMIKTMHGFSQAKKIVEEFKPDLVIGTGGYICGAVITAASKKKIPTVLHESNAYPGLAIRMLAKKVDTIIWAAGPEQYKIIKEEFSKEQIDIDNINGVKIVPYIYNMEEIMNVSDIIVARSGAMTLTEIALVGKPAIFIPLPSMSANRQEDNARVFEKEGAAKVILNNELNGEVLQKAINSMIKDKNKLIEMGENAKKLAIYNVEDRIYEEIEKCLK